MRRIQTGFVAVLTLLLLLGGNAAAAAPATATAANTPPPGPFNVTLTPDAQDLVVKPGGSVSTSFQLRNNGAQTEHLKATVMTFGASGQNGVPQLINPKPQDDFVHWLSMSSPTLDAVPGIWQPVTITIKPPKNAAFGYYYAIVFSRANQPTQKGNTLVGSVVGLILLDVKAPGEKRAASLSEFSTPNKVVEFLPENFTIRMHNNGNVHVAPRGNIFVYKGKKLVDLIIVNNSEGNILPNTNRVYPARWTNGTPVYKTHSPPPGSKNAADKTTLDWSNFQLSHLRFGKYTAKLEMIYNDGQADVPLVAQLSFWVIPWRIIFVIVLIVLLILAGLWALIIRPLRARLKRRGNVGRY